MTEVAVEVVPDAEPSAASAGDSPDVVVVDTGSDDGGSDTATLVGLAATVGALVERVTALEGDVAEVEVDAEIAESVAESALSVAETAGETAATVAEDVATPAELEEVVEDVPPQATPWFARSADEWKKR